MNKSNAIFLLILIVSLWACESEPDRHEGTANASSIQMFSLLSSGTTGVKFNNEVVESSERNYIGFNPIYNGGGVATGDINNDGLPDIYFTGNEVSNKLYLNKGNFKFEDITESAGVSGMGGWKNGVSMVDINHDGWLDIYVCRGGWLKDPALRTNLLYINQGNLKFTEQAAQYRLADVGYSFQSAFFDYDNDGDLDAYIINHPDKSFLSVDDYVAGRTGGSSFSKHHLYRNQGNNTFKDVTQQAGMDQTYSFGLSVSTADLDGNGYLDVYVSSDYTAPDYLFLNNGDGTFTESVKSRTGHISFFSMGIDIADINNDGAEDVFITEMLPENYKRSKINMSSMNPEKFNLMVDKGFHHCYMHNALHLNQGDGYFSEIAQLTGLAKTDWSWACFMSDFDNDGQRDVFVANGYRRDLFDKDAINKMNQYYKEHKNHVTDFTKVMDMYHSEKMKSYFFKNEGDHTFSNMSQDWGITSPAFSNGASIADFDNDGDLDLVVNNMNQHAFLYRNNAEKTGNHFLRVDLEGAPRNLQGLGAKVWVTFDDQSRMEQVKLNRGYLGTVEPIIHFGLGNAKQVKEVKVEWLDGKITTVQDPGMDKMITVSWKQATNPVDQNEKAESKSFSEITAQAFTAPFIHTENEFDDYKNQILLPHRASRNGPFTTVADVNGDGLEDFYVGGAAGQAGVVYLQHTSGAFQPTSNQSFIDDKANEDMGALFFDADGDKDMDLYVVSGGFEFPMDDPAYQDRLYMNDGSGRFTKSHGLPALTSSGSCVINADLDGDGDQDLFVGGRVLPDRYPYPPQSYILINDKGTFQDKTVEIAPQLGKIGMVTSAVWSDFDSDEDEDLLVVGEWMPLKIFKNNNGKLEDVSDQYVPLNTTGWWSRIIACDIDQDGDPDYIAGNLGLNYKFSASPEKPFQVYCDDFDKNGSYDVVLAKYVDKEKVPIRGRECTSQQMPFVAEKYPTYHAFADADLDDIYGNGLKTALNYQATWFASCIFINENGLLHAEKLPVEAQFSTVNGIVAADMDEDGDIDLLLGGNMYHAEVETTRADASYGLMLRHEPDHTFTSLGYVNTGFFIPYDVKDVRMIHLGADKNMGVLVASNNDKLRLFRKNE